MPPATKRRNVSATATHSSTAPAAQRSIQAFGKISKPQVYDPGKSVLGKKSTATHDKDVYSSENSKKRKLGPICSPTDREKTEAASSLDKQAPPIDDGSSRPRERSIESPPASLQTTNPRKYSPLRSSYVETQTKGARSCLESFALTSSSPSNASSPPRTLHHGTPPSSPVSAESEPHQHPKYHQLPDELQDLVNLHSSFLTALSLHYAHNGSMTPADLRILGPGIERAWRKRRVTAHDLRRILAIERSEGHVGHEGAGPLDLSDYGHGKICVGIADHPNSRTATRRPVNEEFLNDMFLRNLKQRWMCYTTNNPADT